MKSVKSILGVTTLAIALSAGFNTALAEGTMKKSHGDTQQRVDKLKDKLSLSDEQTSHVQKVLEDAKVDMEKLRMQMDEIKVKIDNDILAKLDEEQKAKYMDMKAKREAKKMDKKAQ